MRDSIQVSSCEVSKFFPLSITGLKEAICFYEKNAHQTTISIDIRKCNKFPSFPWEEDRHEHIIDIDK